VKQLGIDWNLDNLNLGDLAVSAFTGIMGATNSEVSISDDGATVTAAIQALERGGVLRTLAEPTLTAISGEQASFHAGGEVAIEVDQGDGRTGTEWKEFGVRLSFVPVVLSEGRISLKIGTEVSELTDPVEGRLALNTRKANTTLEL